MPTPDLPPSRLTNNEPVGLKLRAFDPHFSLPHEAGRLVIDAPQYELELGVPEVFEDPDRSDVLRLRYRLADSSGRLHIADSFIGVEHLWRTLRGRAASTDAPMGEPRALHTDAKVYVPTGDDWVFLLSTSASSHTMSQSTVLVRENYFSASLSLYRVPMLSAPRFYARVTTDVDLQRVDGAEVASGTSFWFEIPTDAILWNAGMHYVALDEDERWWEPRRFTPLTFRASEEQGHPNEGVYLNTD
ncbi:MAG: hypothetical protein ABL309_12855 [Phycisphaerales bacterium]